MMSYHYSAKRSTPSSKKDRRGEPAWDLALMFPPQEMWTEEDYLALENNSENRMLELVDGCLEVLPTPDPSHQRIVKFLFKKLNAHVERHGLGEVLLAPLPVKLWDLHVREPDIIFLKPGRITNPHEPPNGADLVVEVVSPGKKNRDRDLKTKRIEYAKAKIRAYWIIDPEKRVITVLRLEAHTYHKHGAFKPRPATSALLSGFTVDVDELFEAGGDPGGN